MFLLEVSWCWGVCGVECGGEDGVTLLFLPPGRVTQGCCCSEGPYRITNNLPSCVPGFCQIPTFTLPVSEPSAYMTMQCSCFISGMTAGFQNSKFYRPGRPWTHTDPLWEALAVLWLVPVYPRRVVAQTHRGLEFRVKLSKKLGSS